jgi:8-oxo-dGTP pyrophosphatase MutT (NUDIX family)
MGVTPGDRTDWREAPGEIEVVLVGRPRDNNWTLPKGTPGHGETQEETALREVCEETGLTVRILEEVGSIHYWFSRRGVRYKKEVLHYLMSPTGGDLSLHDHEYDEARWFPLDEATQRLAHENEIAIVRRAEELIQRRNADAHGG